MKTTYDNKTFSNEDLKFGDKVFPIANGIVKENVFVFEEFDFSDYMCGYPDEPHIILNLNHSSYKPYEVKTSHGYGPKEIYFKIIN